MNDDFFDDPDDPAAEEAMARSDMGPGDHFEPEDERFEQEYPPENDLVFNDEPIVVDAEHHELAPVETKNEVALVGKSDLAISADRTIEQFREMERIKAQLLTSTSDWHTIDGRLVPSATGSIKLIPPFGITFEIISTNEHGDHAVRRERTEWIEYETELVQKEFPGRNGGKYKKFVTERTGNYKLMPMDLYTVTIRATDRWGRYVDMDGSVSTLEEKHAQSDHKMRSIAQTRTQKRALIRLVGGVDANFTDPQEFGRERTFRNNTRAASAKKGDAAPRQYGLRSLYDRAVALQVARDRTSFFAWVSNAVPGCESCISQKVSADQTVAIHNKLTELEGASS